MDEATASPVLDPFGHGAAVQRFLKFHHISRRAPGIDFLGEILAHFSGMPYENLSKIVKMHKSYGSPNRIRLPEEVMEDHALFGLGGTCFSLTYFLLAILSDCGFLCYPIIAHIGRSMNIHCAVVVLLDGRKYLADPGYLLNLPLEIQKSGARVYRTESRGVELTFSPQDEQFCLATFDRTEKKFRYRFADRPVPLDEFVRLWLDSFYWPAMRAVTLSRLTQEGMIYVNKQMVQVQNTHGRQKGVVKDIHLLVKEAFGIAPEWAERAQAAIPDLIARGQEIGVYRKE